MKIKALVGSLFLMANLAAVPSLACDDKACGDAKEGTCEKCEHPKGKDGKTECDHAKCKHHKHDAKKSEKGEKGEKTEAHEGHTHGEGEGHSH